MKFVENYIITLADKLGQLLLEKQLKLATAESCTAGGIAYAITAISGSSQWFEQGLITYSNLSKQTLLSVPKTLLETYGAVSGETVQAMAEGILKNNDAI